MNKTQKITLIGVLSALGIVLIFVKISYPLVPYLYFDVSELVVMFGTSMLGGYGGLAIAIIKSFGNFADGTPLQIGFITAMLSAVSYALVFNLTRKVKLIPRLIIVVLSLTIIMTVFNFFIATPIYYVQTLNFMDVINLNVQFKVGSYSVQVNSISSYLIAILVTYVPFNLMKGTIICIIYFFTERVIYRAYTMIFNK